MTAPGSMFTASWLMQQEFPPLKYVVPGIIPEGMSLFVAAPKIGKSWLALNLGIAVSNGSDALGCIPTGRPRPVLYLALEDGPRRLQDRLASLMPAQGISHRLNFMVDVPEAGVIKTIASFMGAHVGMDPVVILDTLGKVMPPATGNQSAYGHDYKMLSHLKSTSDAVPGSSLIIVHHTRKGEGADFIDAVSGTQGIAGAADTVLVLKRDRQDQRATLQVTSRDTAEGEFALNLSQRGQWTLDGGSLSASAQAAQTAHATSGVDTAMAELIAAVARFPEGISPKDLAIVTGWDPGKVRTYLSRATESGRLHSPQRGLYTPVTTVTSVTSDLLFPPNDTQVTHVTGGE